MYVSESLSTFNFWDKSWNKKRETMQKLLLCPKRGKMLPFSFLLLSLEKRSRGGLQADT
jgi:hypothetical protein